MSKVKFGFKNAYYSKLINTGGVISYATPKKLIGAVSMTLSPVGEDVEFYADDSLYFSDITNNGYDGTLELALIPEDFAKEILGEVEDKNKVLTENAIGVANPFALLCEFTTDDGAKKFVFYHCTASRPELSASTKSTTKEVKTETLNLKIRPDNNAIVKRSTTSATPSSVTDSWYSSVYEPAEEENVDGENA